MQAIYPDHNWNENKFRKPQRYWNDTKNHRAFFDDLASELGIHDHIPSTGYRQDVKNFTDWLSVYGINLQQAISQRGGHSLLTYSKAIPNGTYQPTTVHHLGSFKNGVS